MRGGVERGPGVLKTGMLGATDHALYIMWSGTHEQGHRFRARWTCLPREEALQQSVCLVAARVESAGRQPSL